MTANGMLQAVLFLGIILLLVKPLGLYMAKVYEGQCFMDPVLGFFERSLYRLCAVKPTQEMDWKEYAVSMLVFNLLGIIIVYFIQRFQQFLPLNPQHFTAVPVDLAFNTAVSFATNTNWQAYGGENTLSYLTQMLALTVQNFVSAASGIAVLVALIRGLKRHETKQLGNFWVDLTRGIIYIFLPLSVLLAIALVSQGVIQNLDAYQIITPLQTSTAIHSQTIPMGPAASQIAIKQLGTNGGGFFNANSAHPFENPTPLSNFLEMLAILLIPAALCYTFGRIINNQRQGWAILIAMLIIFVPLTSIDIIAEQYGNPALTQLGVNQHPQDDLFPGGNMEGKETRFGITDSALWASATTATANGSVNAMHDSFTPLGGLIPLWLIQFAEVVFGGVGCGLAEMLIFIMITVFIAGLMVGRTPEYLGKKIEAYEIKMASLIMLIMPLTVLVCTAFGVILPVAKNAMANPGAHGFTEVLYAFTSMANNNGSAFGGLNADTPFFNILGSIVMLIGRYGIAVPVLAIAGALAQKKAVPVSPGTLPTHTPLFIFLLVSVVIIVGALTFFPALALGPIVEQLMMIGK